MLFTFLANSLSLLLLNSEIVTIFVYNSIIYYFVFLNLTQDLSEPEGLNFDCENRRNILGTVEENSNDENDVDDETMSGKKYQMIKLYFLIC